MHVFDDPEEKYDIIIGRDTCQNIGLDIKNNRRQFQWHERTISMVPSNYWKENRKGYRKSSAAEDNKEKEEFQERHDLDRKSVV